MQPSEEVLYKQYKERITELEKRLKTWHSPENLQTACRIRDERIEELKIENAKLNIILYHRENGLSHPDFKPEIEISKQAERIKELESTEDELAFQLGTLKDTLKSYQSTSKIHTDFVKETDKMLQVKEGRIAELEIDKENLRQYASGLENAQNLITVRYKELETLLEQLLWIAEKADTDDSEDTTIELAKQTLKGDK